MRDTIIRSGNTDHRLFGTFFVIAALTLLGFLLLSQAAAADVDCDAVDTGPVVDFQYAIVPGETPPIMVNFYSTSDGGRNDKGGLVDPVDSYVWKFGDGSASEDSNPMHTYGKSSARYQDASEPFPVTLTVKTECGRSNTTTKNVTVYCLDQRAGFTITRPAGDGPFAAPVALFIQDTSLHVADAVTTYHYTLWDSRMTRLFRESTEKDPAFIIPSGGSYVIRQEVYKACSNRSSANTEMKKTIEVSGSASSDTMPMETIPFTTPVPGYSAPATQGTAVPAVPAPPTTAPVISPGDMAPGTGTLSVITTPAGAQVYVDDTLRGVSPARIPDLATGQHTLRLEKSGYRKKTIPFEIWEGDITEYPVTLEAESGGMGIVPVVAVILVIAAGAGAAYWYLKRRKPVKPVVDWNNP